MDPIHDTEWVCETVHHDDDWVRTSSMAFNLYDYFMFVEHDVESIPTLDESLVSAEIKKLFLKHFPQLFTEENYDEMVYVDFKPFAEVYWEDEDISDDELGLAAYIHFRGILVNELYRRFIEKYPEIIIKDYL